MADEKMFWRSHMAEIIHASSSQIEGPFLIDRTQLEALNDILEEEWERFEKERGRRLTQTLDQKFKVESRKARYVDQDESKIRRQIQSEVETSYEFRQRKEYFVFLKNGTVAKVQTFRAALREPDLQDKEPNGLHAVLESCDYTCQVTLTGPHDGLHVSVSPNREPFVQETLMVLKNWQNSVRPPRWQTIWMKIARSSALHWMVWFSAVLLSIFLIEEKAETSQMTPYSQEASRLIVATNFTTDNQGKILQLLLAKSYGYAPQPIKREYPGWFLLLFFGGLIYMVAVSFYPKVEIAVGRGERKVMFWRKYSTFILITTPTFIFSTFLWPKIEPFLKSFF